MRWKSESTPWESVGKKWYMEPLIWKKHQDQWCLLGIALREEGRGQGGPACQTRPGGTTTISVLLPLYTAQGLAVWGTLSQELLPTQLAIARVSLAWHRLQGRPSGSWGWPSSSQQTVNPALSTSGISWRDQCFQMLQGLIWFSPFLAKPLLHAKGLHVNTHLRGCCQQDTATSSVKQGPG